MSERNTTTVHVHGAMAIVLLVIFVWGDPDLLDALIALLSAKGTCP